jgi:hypothetical protein
MGENAPDLIPVDAEPDHQIMHPFRFGRPSGNCPVGQGAGGDVPHDFAFARLVNMIVGVYSTIFIANLILIY